jgi:hypothetical protein
LDDPPADTHRTEAGRHTIRRPQWSLPLRAAIRQKELNFLLHFRRKFGRSVDAAGYLEVAGRTVLDKSSRIAHFPELRESTAVAILLNAGLDLAPTALAAVVSNVNRSAQATWAARSKAQFAAADMTAERAGQLLELTSEERDNIGIVTIEASNESRAARAERKLMNKRIRDRERKSEKRRDAGRLARTEYEAKSLSRLKPWEAEGISRRTWYGRRGTSVHAAETAQVRRGQ